MKTFYILQEQYTVDKHVSQPFSYMYYVSLNISHRRYRNQYNCNIYDYIHYTRGTTDKSKNVFLEILAAAQFYILRYLYRSYTLTPG